MTVALATRGHYCAPFGASLATAGHYCIGDVPALVECVVRFQVIRTQAECLITTPLLEATLATPRHEFAVTTPLAQFQLRRQPAALQLYVDCL